MTRAGISALYVHVPFCVRKCAYCDFASRTYAVPGDAFVSYVRTLCSHLTRVGSSGLLSTCVTAYVGGGTPTILGPSLLGELVREIRRWCPKLTELTCEANPDSLSDEVISEVGGAGATRLSIGVQSLQDGELKALGRVHDARTARERVAAAVGSGFEVSVDLMCAIPLQTSCSWRDTLEQVVALGPGHVSVYPLTIEEGTPFWGRYGEAEPAWNDEDVQAERMEAAAAVLGMSGYERYEVASYARRGRACAHNAAYWTGASYLGLGVAAASMFDADTYRAVRALCPRLPAIDDDVARVRMTNVDDVDRMVSGMGFDESRYDLELLNARQAVAEDLMLGMRLSEGVSERLVAECPPEVWDGLIERGLVTKRGPRMVPTHRGWLLGNELYGALWALAEEPVREASAV